MGAPRRLSYNRSAMRSLPHGLVAAVLAACVLSGAALADTDAETPKATEPAPAPAPDAPPAKSLDLDRLLHPAAVRMQPSCSILGGRDQKGCRGERCRARRGGACRAGP